ncbi:hypothetical protein WISP_136184 [Willisornis vidua]|uniref:Rna-directed dna polymerase from mobile element jockey-like n=1 Tax=Willisornis vidua TaxID=1566151 RepID=A0ABQ9CT95_9PASS|nr:hypothetical protein WISP_136184 [Willisornis vidua]
MRISTVVTFPMLIHLCKLTSKPGVCSLITRQLIPLDKLSSTQLDKHIISWGFIVKPVLFSIFISDLDLGLEGGSQFGDDTELGGGVDSLKDREALQRDLDKLENWATTNHVKFKKGKCWILHLEWGNPGCSHRLGNEMLESSAMERDLGVLVDKLNMSQQCPGSQEGQPCPGGIKHSITSQAREGIVPLCSALV